MASKPSLISLRFVIKVKNESITLRVLDSRADSTNQYTQLAAVVARSV